MHLRHTTEGPGLPLGYRVASKAPLGFHSKARPEAGASPSQLLRDHTDSHWAVIAPTGAGKGVSFAVPLAVWDEGAANQQSKVVVDVKAEISSITARALQRRGYDVRIVNPFGVHTANGKSQDSFNPLETVSRDEDMEDDLATLALLIVGEAPSSYQDPFWRQQALHLFIGLLGWVIVRREVTGKMREDDGTVGAVLSMLNEDDLVYNLAVLADAHSSHPALPKFIGESFANFLQHEDKVRASVRSELVSLFHVFGTPRMRAVMSTTTIPLQKLQDGDPIVVFIVLPPSRLESHAAWARVCIGALMQLMMRRSAKPRVPTLFLIDELAHLGPIPQIKQAITLARGYGIRVALFLQSIHQLKALWPADYETVLHNCGTWVNFGNATMTAARQIADHLGDISAEELFRMPAGHMAVHRAGQATELLRRMDYRSDEIFAGQFDANPYYAASAAAPSQREMF